MLGALAAVLICAAAVFALTRPGDVFNKDDEFRAEPEQTFVPTPQARKKTKKHKKDKMDKMDKMDEQNK